MGGPSARSWQSSSLRAKSSSLRAGGGSARAGANEGREAAPKFENRRRAAAKFLKTTVLNGRFAIGKYRFARSTVTLPGRSRRSDTHPKLVRGGV